jgi:hypothetical protein
MNEMLSGILTASVALGGLGLVAALLLFFISKTFAVEENQKLRLSWIFYQE